MRLAAFKDLTRPEQTLFGLPFLLSGAVLSFTNPFPLENRWSWVWVLPAFFLARISGMAFNQLIDRAIDAKNPRTQHRVIPSGRISVKQARFIAWGSLILFLGICFQINLITAFLAIPAAFLLFIYSYLKRVHVACHWVLGLIHLLGPFMAYTAIRGEYSLPPLILGAAACCCIVGVDIVYAIQDFEFDSQNKLKSIPTRFGINNSLMISGCMHAASTLFLFSVGYTLHLPLFYYLLIPIVSGAFYLFHRQVRALLNSKKTQGIEKKFFFCTLTVSCVTLFFIAASVLWDALL